MSTVRRKPNYVRDWFQVRKESWKKFVEERIKEAKAKGLIDQFFKLHPKIIEREEMKRIGFTNTEGEGSMEDPNSEGDIDHEDFYSDEEDESKKFKGKKLGGVFRREAKNDGKGTVDEEGYFRRVLKHQPDSPKWKSLIKKKEQYLPNKIKERFEQEQQN